MAKNGFGATFQLSLTPITGTSGAVAELLSVPQPVFNNAALETTNHGSPGGIQEFIPSGVIEQGEMTVNMNHTPGSASDTAWTNAAVSRALYFWRATIPAATGAVAYSGMCVVTGFEPGEAEIDGKLEAVGTIQPSGPITKAAA